MKNVCHKHWIWFPNFAKLSCEIISPMWHFPLFYLPKGYVFTRVCHSVRGGWWYPSMHYSWYPSIPCSRSRGGIPACLAGFQAHTRGEVEGSGRRVSRPTPGGGGCQAHTHPGGCILACTEANPLPRRLLLRAVRILLEWILVLILFYCFKSTKDKHATLEGLTLAKTLN